MYFLSSFANFTSFLLCNIAIKKLIGAIIQLLLPPVCGSWTNWSKICSHNTIWESPLPAESFLVQLPQSNIGNLFLKYSKRLNYVCLLDYDPSLVFFSHVTADFFPAKLACVCCTSKTRCKFSRKIKLFLELNSKMSLKMLHKLCLWTPGWLLCYITAALPSGVTIQSSSLTQLSHQIQKENWIQVPKK